MTRLLALRVLERVSSAGAYADLALHAALSQSSLNAPDRAFATDLVYGTLRARGSIDFYLRKLTDQDLYKLEPLVLTTLRLGAYQLIFMDSVPANAAVDQSVRCIRAAGIDRATGFINAILRRLATEHQSIELPSLEESPKDHLIHALSIPGWLAKRWLKHYGVETAVALARASNAIPPLTIRANLLKGSAADLLAEMRERFPDAAPCRFARDGIVLGRKGNPALDPGFLAGRFTVQDEASQLVVGLLDPKPGEKILDICAAPGGKTTAIAERVGASGEVVAIDRHPRRLALAERAARRLGLDNVRCIPTDATRQLSDLSPEGGFDRILVDAPCSGLGTLRRNPDARWRVRPEDPARLAEIQKAILSNAASVLRPGGVLVYSVCTLLPEENEEIADWFLETTKDFFAAPAELLPAEVQSVIDRAGYLRPLPQLHDTDGFFAVRFERKK
jgi:16S rRNA (cytosine967-C5)-methyltransferase